MYNYFAVDSHAHLSSLSDVNLAFEKSVKNGISTIININTSIEDFEKTKILNYPNIKIYHSISITPQDAFNYEECIKVNNFIKEKLKYKNSNIVAIGETGLDAPFTEKNSLQSQIKALKLFYETAKEFSLPLILHCRDAFDELIDFLKENNKVTGIIHCFTGSYNQAIELINMGWVISISGILTFKKSDDLRNIVERLPLNKLVIETDSPYLSPVPFRGKENNPSNILYIAKEIARIKNISLEEVIKTTTNTVKNLLKIT